MGLYGVLLVHTATLSVQLFLLVLRTNLVLFRKRGSHQQIDDGRYVSGVCLGLAFAREGARLGLMTCP